MEETNHPDAPAFAVLVRRVVTGIGTAREEAEGVDRSEKRDVGGGDGEPDHAAAPSTGRET